MERATLPNGVALDQSPYLSVHVQKNRHYLTEELGREVSDYEALLDLFTADGKIEKAIMGGYKPHERLSRCDGCGKLYDKSNGDWQVIAEPNGKKIPDGEIPLNYSWRDEEGFHYIDSIKISGDECIPCLQKNEVLAKRSKEKVKKDTLGWLHSLYRIIRPGDLEEAPADVRRKLQSEGLV